MVEKRESFILNLALKDYDVEFDMEVCLGCLYIFQKVRICFFYKNCFRCFSGRLFCVYRRLFVRRCSRDVDAVADNEIRIRKLVRRIVPRGNSRKSGLPSLKIGILRVKGVI